MFFSFDTGDYLIHHKYGVGKFIGIEALSINNTSLDFFKIEYLNESFLLIPSYNIGVFKFHSNKNSATKIENLGRSAILKKQQKAKDQIARTAGELIEIYKARESIFVPSFSFNDDYKKFCEAFPFELTKSQNKVLFEITNDLAKTKPMDRLLCGDVGFGKTEVAARAIALAVTNGFKAIFIVPTTILASQHFNALKERFSLINKKCGVLSKLNDKLDNTKQSWFAREIDLLITTAHHKGIENLIIDDLELIVLDEEHHFGVKFKEKIRLKAHSLQLSATPIPRTLHLAMSKIKDISLLEMPPVGRKETQVHVSSLHDLDLNLLIKTELSKGGKVFLVVPRVQQIAEIEKMISFVKYVVLHGQLSKEQTNQALLDFVDGNIHVLISTNIIESGINILSANLMIIFYAHMFGVAQLHQLKGRVGRGNDNSAVYFIVPNILKEISADRINMIKNNSAIGGGFSLSMQDMEFRGSGTIVGHKQSGKDYGFGVEMYFEMLSECIGTTVAKKNEKKIAWIGFLDASIPSDYIVDNKIRFSFYKKLSLISSLSELNEIIADLKEFGELPDALISFLQIVRINLISNYLNIIKVVQLSNEVELFYDDISLDLFVKLQKLAKINCVDKKIILNDLSINEVIDVLEQKKL